MGASDRLKAIQAIEKRGALLVYPLNNRKEPLSLWSELHPRTRMVWDWNEDGDNRVADLWHLRMLLSKSRKVVYTKWYQNRATFFSFEVFTHLLAFLGAYATDDLSHHSRNILEILEADSPLSTKQLKVACELEGRLNEGDYNRAMRPLWQRLRLVGFGEFEDSSFPSLGIGAAKTLFEDLWSEGQSLEVHVAEQFLKEKLGEANPFFKYAVKLSRAARTSR
jgi:hypothetical protein